MPKLHLPGPAGLATACGRNMNNNRADRAQVATNATLATSADEYFIALRQGKACRHCGRAAGILTKLTRTARNADSEEGDDSDE